MPVTIETIQNVYDDKSRAYISVGPDQDGLGGLVRISTSGLGELEFGKADLVVNFELAKALGQVLLKAVEVLPAS